MKKKKELTPEEILWEKQAAQDYFDDHTLPEVQEMFNELFFGAGKLDYDRWFAGEKPTGVFLNELDRLRMQAEV